MSESYDFGREAEAFVAQKYLAKDYKILAQNWHYQKAEIDIIAQKGNTLVVVEVKARSYDGVASPESAINAKKRQLLIMAADAFLTEKVLDYEVRFDVVSVIKTPQGLKARFLVDAFKAFE